MSIDAARGNERVGSQWLTLEEAARYLKVSKPTIYRLCRQKKLAFYKLAATGGRRFRRGDLDTLMVRDLAEQPPQLGRFTAETLRWAFSTADRIMRGRYFSEDSADIIREAREERMNQL